MFKQTVLTVAAAALLTVSAGAQSLTGAAASRLTAVDVEQAAPAAVTPQTQGPQARPVEPVGQAVNVSIELTIAETGGSGSTKKVVSMIVADRQSGFVRSRGRVKVGQEGRDVAINVDAKPIVTREGAIRLDLGLEYQPRVGGESATTALPGGSNLLLSEPTFSNLNQRIGVVLESGKPLLISQAADPGSDRQITVTVKATILK